MDPRGAREGDPVSAAKPAPATATHWATDLAANEVERRATLERAAIVDREQRAEQLKRIYLGAPPFAGSVVREADAILDAYHVGLREPRLKASLEVMRGGTAGEVLIVRELEGARQLVVEFFDGTDPAAKGTPPPVDFGIRRGGRVPQPPRIVAEAELGAPSVTRGERFRLQLDYELVDGELCAIHRGERLTPAAVARLVLEPFLVALVEG